MSPPAGHPPPATHRLAGVLDSDRLPSRTTVHSLAHLQLSLVSCRKRLRAAHANGVWVEPAPSALSAASPNTAACPCALALACTCSNATRGAACVVHITTYYTLTHRFSFHDAWIILGTAPQPQPQPGKSASIATGPLLLIIVGANFAIYCGAGIAMARKKGSAGLETIPNVFATFFFVFWVVRAGVVLDAPHLNRLEYYFIC